MMPNKKKVKEENEWEHNVAMKDKDLDDNADIEELMLTSSITHSVTPILVREQGEIYSTVYNISFPFDWQVKTSLHSSLSYSNVFYHFQLSKDGRLYIFKNRIEGYGFVEIPRVPGFHKITVKTWKPALNLNNKMSSFFLGGSIKVKEIENIANTYSEFEEAGGTILNRFSLSSETGGEVVLRINVAKQAKQYRHVMREQKKQINDKEAVYEKEQAIQRKNPKQGPSLMLGPLGFNPRF